MRMLKTLAAVLAGMLLLALPAVAVPQAPAPEDCVAEEEAATEEGEEEADTEVEKTAEAEPTDPCVPQEQQGGSTNALNEILGGLGL